MAAIVTLTVIQQHLSAWLAASLAIAESQSYSINGRTLTRANAAEVQNQINYWQGLETQELKRQAGQGGLSIKLAKFS